MKESFISYSLAKELHQVLCLDLYVPTSYSIYKYYSENLYVYFKQDKFFSARQWKRDSIMTIKTYDYFHTRSFDRDSWTIYPKFTLDELIQQYHNIKLDTFCKKYNIELVVCELNWLTRIEKEINSPNLKEWDYVLVRYCWEEIEFCDEDQDTLVNSLWYAIKYIDSIIISKKDPDYFSSALRLIESGYEE